MCRYFAVALARNGVTVNAVSPGASDESTLIGQPPKEVQDALKECGFRLDANAQACDALGYRKCVRAFL